MTIEEWRKELEKHYNGWEDQVDAKAILDDWKVDREALEKELEKKPSITLLSDGNGWYWLYVDKKLVRNGHNCADLQVLCEVLKLPFEYCDWDAGEFGEIKPPEKLDAPTST